MTSIIARNPRAVVLTLIAAGLLLGLIAGNALLSSRQASADGHLSGLENVVVGSQVVDHELGRRTSRETVRIWGSGFAPGQEVILLVNDGPGTPSDITNYVSNKSADNTLVANDQGAWTAVWTLGRFTRQRSGIGPGDGDVERMRALSAIDPGTFDVVASTPLAFCRVTDRANEVAAGVAAAEAVVEERQAAVDALTASIEEQQSAIETMQAALTEYRANVVPPLPERPVNVTDAAWGLATQFYAGVKAAEDAQIAEMEAGIADAQASLASSQSDLEAATAALESAMADVETAKEASPETPTPAHCPA